MRKEIIINGGGECIRSDVGLKALKLVLVKSGIEVAHQNGDKFGFGLEGKGLEFVPKM